MQILKNERFYGRRRGRRIRAGREKLFLNLLPKVLFTISEETPKPKRWFDQSLRDIWLEIGFGAGEHLAAQATVNPDVGFIGCEPFRNGVAHLLARIEGECLSNIKVFPDDARLLIKKLPEGSIGRVFALFPDPWPKLRHHRRRLINPEMIQYLSQILKMGGELCLASDDVEYIRWMLYHTLDHGGFEWKAQRPADWRCRPPDWQPTRYEKKALDRGDQCYYLKFCLKRKS